jgi:hypothetical protein
VNAHLEHVPCLGTFSVRCLTGADLQVLGWQTDGALDAQVLGLCAVNQLGADLLEGLDVAGCEGDADLVDFLFVVLLVCFAPGEEEDKMEGISGGGE